MSKFYVYEHWRPDKGECFYVGKGYGKRANAMRGRNRHHKNIQNKLSSLGMAVEVRIYAGGLTEEEALKTEIARIAFWKEQGFTLANIALGGGGTAGVRLSAERIEEIRKSKRGNKYRLGAVLSQETRNKIAIAHTGKKLSAEHLKKMSEAALGEKNPFFGKKHSEETGRKIAQANRKRVWTQESRQKLSETNTGRKHPKRTTTWTHSDETKKRMSDARKAYWSRKRAEKCLTQPLF